MMALLRASVVGANKHPHQQQFAINSPRFVSHPPEQRMVPAGAAVTAIGVAVVTEDATFNDLLSDEQPSVTLAWYVLHDMSKSTRNSIHTHTKNRTRPESA